MVLAGGGGSSHSRYTLGQRKWNGRAPQGRQLYDDVTLLSARKGKAISIGRSDLSLSAIVSLKSGRYRSSGRFGELPSDDLRSTSAEACLTRNRLERALTFSPVKAHPQCFEKSGTNASVIGTFESQKGTYTTA